MNPYNTAHLPVRQQDGIAIARPSAPTWVKLNWTSSTMQRYEGNLIDNLRKGKEHIGYVQLADSPDRPRAGDRQVNLITQVSA